MEIPILVAISVLVVFTLLTFLSGLMWVVNGWRHSRHGRSRPEANRPGMESRTIPGSNRRTSD